MKQKRNQGFTLVELLVSIAVLSIVTLGIGGLLRLAAEQYSNATKETEVQNVLQQTVASVSNTMEDAELGVFFAGNTLTVANREKYFKFERSGSVLYYDEKMYMSAVDDDEKIDEAKSGSVGHNQENVLADHITQFSVTIPEVLPGDKQGFAVLTVGIQFQERGKDISQNVFFRNYSAEAFQVSSTLAGGGSPIPGGGGGGGGGNPVTNTPAGPTALPGNTPTPTPITSTSTPTPITSTPTPITPTTSGGGGGGGGGGNPAYVGNLPGTVQVGNASSVPVSTSDPMWGGNHFEIDVSGNQKVYSITVKVEGNMASINTSSLDWRYQDGVRDLGNGLFSITYTKNDTSNKPIDKIRFGVDVASGSPAPKVTLQAISYYVE